MKMTRREFFQASVASAALGWAVVGGAAEQASEKIDAELPEGLKAAHDGLELVLG